MIKRSDRLLVISNNPFSHEQSNGKTIFSLVSNLPKKQVRQLYFNSAFPGVKGYNYFRISDYDVVKSKFNSSSKGIEIKNINLSKSDEQVDKGNIKIKPTSILRILREILWFNSWKSEKLFKWLDDFKPNKIFFLCGDSLFAYDICRCIKDKYNCKLYLYVTDDYLHRTLRYGFFEYLRSKLVFRRMKNIMPEVKKFFTINKIMQNEYRNIFNKHSDILYNSIESLYDKRLVKKKGAAREMIYAGSLYYGRENQIKKIASVVENYNLNSKEKLFFSVYTSSNMSLNFKYTKIYKMIDFNELVKKYNYADILLFVESFEKKFIEKVKYSFSTKIPEYLSLKKPIFAVGDKNIGSMNELKNVAICAYNDNNIQKEFYKLINNVKLQKNVANKAFSLYKRKYQRIFLSNFLN